MKTLYGSIGADTGRGQSGTIWGDCPWLEIMEDCGRGIQFFDDFVAYPTAATTVGTGPWYPVFEGDCTVAQGSAAYGTLAIFGTTDNEEAGVQLGGPAGAPFVISDTAGSDKKLWFECRIKKSVITDDIGGFFVGFASEGALAADFMADGGADFSDVDLIGFWNDETDATAAGADVNFIYQITGQDFVTAISGVDTLVADTYVKWGFVYDPKAAAANRIMAYVNGVASSTCITATNIATATFPDGEEMSPICAIKMSSDSDLTVTMDWIKVAQLV